MKSKNKRRAFIAVLSVFAISATGAALAGCNKTVGYIDAPASLEAELGTYVIPDYEVVDKNGMILAGYNVQLKSVKNANGEDVNSIVGSAVTIDDAGVYSFVYSANSKKVKDVTVSIDFADRTAPTINYEDDLPKFFIKGNSYKMPSYTLSGDYDRTKCWAKVFHIAEDKTETEVSITSNRFKVDHSSGSYAIRIHVEDAAGNANDYEYVRKVDGPETVVDHKVLYLDEEFGARQVSCYQSKYTGGYVSKDADGAHYYGEGRKDGEYKENGAYKVSFDGVSETQYNEGLVVMDVPAIININEYEELYMYVYNDSGKEIRMGSQWWNDTVVPAGEWTRLSWNTREWGNNMSANNTKPVGLVDITGMTIRFIFDYGQTVIPNGDFYLSAMYGTPKVESEITLGENVDISGGKHYVNDIIEINATPVEGKTVDYFTVDGEIIPGNTFIVTNESHTIEVHYVDGDLTLDNMTWADRDELNPAGSDVQTQYMGTDENWVMSYDVYNADSAWEFFGVYVGGTNQLLGFELVNDTGKLCGYGGAWKWGDGVQLTPEICSLIRGATEANPVKAVYVRRGNEIRVFIISDGITYFAGSVEFSVFGVTGNNFGFGMRAPGKNSPDCVTAVNFEAVAGEKKTNLYFFSGEYDAELTVDGVKAEDKYYIGDKITLEPEAPADENKLFAYFKVNGKRIDGKQFYLLIAETSVETVYTDKSTVVLAEGIKTADGKTGEVVVAQDTYLVIDYIGKAHAGKYFVGFKVDGEQVIGTEIYISKDTHTVEVLFADKEQTGNDKLNEITGDVIYAKDDDGEDKWKPASVEHVTDFRFDGNDAAVDENSVLKIVTGSDSGENSFAFNSSLVQNLDGYKEIYFYVYTEASGLKAGGWWCNDTNLIAGKWTKVSFRRTDAKKPGTIEGNGESIVWEDGLEKFAFRIFSAPEGTSVYVTAVYGVPYADVEVTAADGVTVSDPANGKTYKEGETVTLYAAEAPAGKVFAYFTANGDPVDGNKFKLTGKVEFGVVYNEFSTVTLADGIETDDGKTGTFNVARNVPVYLKLTDETKYYLSFSVDGEAIAGNSFTPTEGKTYSVTVTVENRVANGNSQLSDISSAAMHSGEAELDFTGHISYNGADGVVKEDGSVRVSEIGGNDIAIKATEAIGEADLTNFKEVYFYVYTESDGVKAGTYWCNDTDAVKGQWTKVTVYKDANKNSCVGQPYDADGVNGKLFAAGSKGSNFVYRIQGGEGKTVYLTSLYGVPYADSTVKIADDSKDSLTVSAPANGTQYKEGETVTLTAADAPAGQAFAYFTADGESIDGDKFTLKAGEVTFGVVYSEISVITLGEGVTAEHAEDGRLTVGRGAIVHIEFVGEVPSGKYFIGFKVDGEPVDGDTFTAEGAAHSVEAVFADKEQTGNVKLNEISTVAEDGLSYHPTQSGWKPEKIEYVTDVKYTGKDGAVDESGSLKVTLKSGEQAFALNKTLINKLDEYKEIFFYVYAEKNTDVSGAIAGGWWCNDTAIVAGQWTKVSFTRAANPLNISEKSVWAENSIDKFTYRFNNAKAGTTVYVTAVYGVLYDEVSVTVEESVKDYIEVSGTFREGQTITLSHTGAPENKQFVHFTINGERHEGNTYKLGTEPVVVGAYFTDAKATLTLGAGVNTSDGEKVYALGEKVTLKPDGLSDGKVLDYFKVDGEKISGDTFVTSSATHKVEAVIVNGIENLTWITEEEADATDVSYNWSAYSFSGTSAGEATHWAIEAKAYGFTTLGDDWYSVDFLVGNNASFQIRLHSAGNAQIYAMGANHNDGSELAKLDASVIDACKAATEEDPVTFTAVRSGETYFILFNGELVLTTKFAFDTDDNKFGVGGTDCGAWLKKHPTVNYAFRTGEVFTDCLTDVNLTGTKVSFDKSAYKLGDSVELSPDAAATDYVFTHFEVDGVKLNGNSFIATKRSHEVIAVYATLEETYHIEVAQPKTVFSENGEVTLPTASVKDINGDTVSGYTVTATVTDVTGNSYEVSDGKIQIGYKGAIDLTVKYSCESLNEETVTFTVQSSDGNVILEATELGAKTVKANNSVITFDSTVKHGDDQGSIKIHVNQRSQDQDYGYLNAFSGYDFVEFYVYTEKEGMNAGAWWYGDTVLTKDGWTRVRLQVKDTNLKDGKRWTLRLVNHTDADSIIGADFWISSVKGYKYAVNQINDICSAEVYEGTAELTHVTDIPGTLPVAADGGVLKVNFSAGGSTSVTVKSSVSGDISDYDAVCFYVYVDSANFKSGMKAGTYWCCDTDLVSGEWVQIIVYRDPAKNPHTYNYDADSSLGGKFFAGNGSGFIFRLIDCNNCDVYISSLYGMPKTEEKMVENGKTDYSVVSDNGELEKILNDNFFPDAE